MVGARESTGPKWQRSQGTPSMESDIARNATARDAPKTTHRSKNAARQLAASALPGERSLTTYAGLAGMRELVPVAVR